MLLLSALSVFLTLFAACLPARALTQLEANGIDAGKKGTITLKIPDDKSSWYIEGSQFRLYYVASLESDMTFRLTDNFRNYTASDLQAVTPTNNEATASKWMEAATSLIEYVRENNIPQDQVRAMTDKTVTFSDLALGLYLIQGDTATEGNRTVTYQPVVICIPQRESAEDPWKYDIEAEVKHADPTYSNPTDTPTPGPTETPSVTPSVTATPSVTGTPSPSTTAVPTKTVTPSPGSGSGGNTPGGGSSGKTTVTGTSPSGSGSGSTGILSVLTGDTSGIMTYAGAMIASAAAVCLVLILRKRHNDGQ